MAQLAHMHGLDFVLRPTEQSGPGRIHADEIALEIGHAEQIFRDVPDAVALQRSPFNLGFQLFTERAQLRLGTRARAIGVFLPGDSEERRNPSVDLSSHIQFRSVRDEQATRSDSRKGEFTFEINRLASQYLVNVGAKRIETLLAEHFRNRFSDDIFAPKPDQVRVGLADETIT